MIMSLPFAENSHPKEARKKNPAHDFPKRDQVKELIIPLGDFYLN